MSTISSSNYYSVGSSGNGLAGLMSGMDTESMVKKMLGGTQTKINKQTQLKTQTEWKQEVYHDVITDINAFSGKYFDMSYGSSLATNLGSTSLFNSMKAAVSSGSAVKVVSADSSAFTGNMSVIVNKLASAAKLSASVKLSGDQTINGNAMDIDAIKAGVANGGETSFTLTLDGISKTLSFKSEDFGAEINETSIKTALDSKLSKAFGTYVTAGMDGGKLSFSINLKDGEGNPESGHELTVTGASARAFGITPGASSLVTGMTKLESLAGLQGSTYNFTINGTAFSFDGSKTVSGLINEINTSSAGVKIAYSSMTDAFSIEATSTGAQYGVELSQETGNLLSVLFGSDKISAAENIRSSSLQNTGINANPEASYTSVNGGQMQLSVNGTDYTFTLANSASGYTKEQLAETLNSWLVSTFGQTTEGSANISYSAETGVMTALNGYALTFSENESDLAFSLGFSGKTNAVTGDTAIADLQKLSGINGSFLKADGTTPATTLSEVASFRTEGGTSYSISFLNGALSLTGSGNIDLTGTGLESLFGTEFTLGNGAMASNAVKAGTDAELVINGVTTSRSSNTFTVDGLTLTAVKETGESEAATLISTERDVDNVVSTIKSFVNDYNSLIKKLNDLIKQDATYRNYAPLTDAQREEMSEKEIELWETKAKTGLVRNDSTISSFLAQMRGAMYMSSETGGLALYNIGIETGKWDTAGQLVLDETKLRNAIASDPDGVQSLFADRNNGLAKRLSTIADGVAKLSVATPGALVKLAGAKDWSANAKNNEMYIQLYTINDKLKTLQSKYNTERERYWTQFSAMETSMASLSSQSNMITSMFSNY